MEKYLSRFSIKDDFTHDRKSFSRHEFDKHGRGEPRRSQRRRDQTRNLQGDIEKNPGDSPVQIDRSFGQLRSHSQRVFLRPASRCVRTSPQLLQVS